MDTSTEEQAVCRGVANSSVSIRCFVSQLGEGCEAKELALLLLYAASDASMRTSTSKLNLSDSDEEGGK